MQDWVAVADLKFVVSRKKINFIYSLCHVSMASCLFCLLSPVSCCCHSQFTFYSVVIWWICPHIFSVWHFSPPEPDLLSQSLHCGRKPTMNSKHCKERFIQFPSNIHSQVLQLPEESSLFLVCLLCFFFRYCSCFVVALFSFILFSYK